MAPLTFWCLVVAWMCAHGLQYDTVAVTGNPHMPEANGFDACPSKQAEEFPSVAFGCPALGVLDPSTVLSGPVSTQAGSFLKIVTKRYLGRDVLIFHFKQPSELNPAQLPFRVVRVSHVESSGLLTILVEVDMAYNSWFPQYYWSIVVCQKCDGMVHLGWKFTSKTAGDADSFYALIVDYADGHEREATTAERLIEQLQVGVRAPAWMIAMASMTMTTALSK